MLFIYFVIPLSENILSFLGAWLKYQETRFSTETYKISKRAQKEVEESTSSVSKIGFSYEEENPKEEDEDDDS